MGATRVLPGNWLHDDTEEDLVGASWHQRAIRTTSRSLEHVADQRGLPWLIGDQLTLVATKPDGTAWRPSPDIMLYEHGGQGERAEMVVAQDGLPSLVIEVLSRSTWEYDVDAQGGKAWGFLQLGVPFYLVFDPHADLQGESCRGWRQDGRQLRAWLPEPDGRYHIPRLGISFQPEDSLLRVYDQDSQPVPFDFEVDLRLRITEEDRDLQTQRAEEERRRADDLAQRLAALEAEMARLRQQE